MLIVNGSAISREARPRMSSKPPTISSPATARAVNSGAGKPRVVKKLTTLSIFSNLPRPVMKN